MTRYRENANPVYRIAHPGYVYFIQSKTTGYIKIGFTVDLARRFPELGICKWKPQTHSIVLGVYPGNLHTEARLHHMFRRHYAFWRSEEFHPEPDILDWIHRNADIHYQAYFD